MTKKFTYVEKQEGDALTAAEWNNLAQDVSAAVDSINNGNTNGGYGDVPSYITPLKEVGVTDRVTFEFSEQPSGAVGGSNIHGAAIELTDKGDKGVNVSLVGNNNINIEPREALGTGEGKNKVDDINRKGGNIALKPGDDIELWAHHRGSSKNDEVSVKVMTEVPKQSDPTKKDEIAAKLQLNTADIVLTSKDKQLESGELNVTVNKAPNTRGYLKVRAQAIDLRCEDHGGIALQPKGDDGNGHENKIKFEHNGGDGLEFGTFNTQHTSIFTNDYRFNENGTVYAVTREAPVDTHENPNDPNSPVKKTDYPTQADDFKDVIDESKGATWGAIVNTANAMNNDQIETRIADYESIGKRGLLISGRKCVRVISNSRSEIQALIDNSDPTVDQVSISTDNETTAEILSDTYAPFTGTFPVGEILDIEKLKYTAGRYTGLEASLYELSLHDNGYKKIIYFTNSQDVALFLEVVTYDITFATEQPFPYNLHNPDTDPLWPEHSVSVSDLIKLVEWFKKPANVFNAGSVNPFNLQSNP